MVDLVGMINASIVSSRSCQHRTSSKRVIWLLAECCGLPQFFSYSILKACFLRRSGGSREHSIVSESVGVDLRVPVIIRIVLFSCIWISVYKIFSAEKSNEIILSFNFSSKFCWLLYSQLKLGLMDGWSY